MTTNIRIKMDSELLFTELEKLPASGLTIELKSDRYLLVIYLFFFVLLLTSVLLLPLSIWLIILFMLGLSAFFQLLIRKCFLLNHPDSVKKITFTEVNWCFIQLNNSKVLKAKILPETVLTEFIVILNLQDTEKSSQPILKRVFFANYYILITAQSIGIENFWKLKRYLRFKHLTKQKA